MLSSSSRRTLSRPDATVLRKLHPDKPLRWHDFADLWLERPLGRVLDYGCGDGSFLSRIADGCITRTGVDIDPVKVAQASCREGIRSLRIRPGQPLPFNNEAFNTVIIQEVIEHVANEHAVLEELSRVLAPNGRLLLTTPHRGLLTFLDPGNVKFVAPRFHRFVHVRILGHRDYYVSRFGAARKSRDRMIADFTTDQQAWHRHYTYPQIRSLTPKCLKTVGWAVYYPAFRALWLLAQVLKVISQNRIKTLPVPLQRLDNRLSRVESLSGDQLVVLFRKIVD